MNNPANSPGKREEQPAEPSSTVTSIVLICAVLIAAHMGLKYQSWQVFVLFFVPLLIVAIFFARIIRRIRGAIKAS